MFQHVQDGGGRLTGFFILEHSEPTLSWLLHAVKHISPLCFPLTKVNDVLVNLPFLFNSGKIYAYHTGSSVIIQTDFGLSVSCGRASYVSVSIPETYSGSLCGLGGDFNGDRDNDFRTPNGSVVQDAVSFGDSWKDPRSPFHCMVTGPSTSCNDTEHAQYRSRHYCGLISDGEGPFKDCHSSVDAQVHFENCVKDMCAVHGNRNALCELLTTFAQQCQAKGTNIRSWREIARCGRLFWMVGCSYSLS